MTALKKQVEKIRRRVGPTAQPIELTDDERAWMDARPERHIRKANDGSPFAVLSYNPGNQADELTAQAIADKVKAAGGNSMAFLIDDDENN